MKTLKNNENGSALVVVMMILVVLSLLGASLATVTLGSLQLGNNSRDYNSAYYIAEAGANLAYADIENNIIDTHTNNQITSEYFKQIKSLPRGTYLDFEPQFGEKPIATVEVSEPLPTEDEFERDYIITSTGKIGNNTRTVEKKITVRYHEENTGGGSFPFDLDAAIVFNTKGQFNNGLDLIGGIEYPEGSSLIVQNGNIPKEQIKVVPKNDFNWDQKVIAYTSWLNSWADNYKSTLNYGADNSGGLSFQPGTTYAGNIIGKNKSLRFQDRATVEGDVIVTNGNLAFGTDAKIIGNVIVLDGNITFADRPNVKGNIITINGKITIGSLNNDQKIEGSIISLGTNNGIWIGKGDIIGNIMADGGEIFFQNEISVEGAIMNPKGKITIQNKTNQKGIKGVMVGNEIFGQNGVKVEKNTDLSGKFPFDTGIGNSEPITLEDLLETAPAKENN